MFEEKILATLEQLVVRMDRMEKSQSRNVIKDAYTSDETAEKIGKSAYTVRQWANFGCIKAHKVRGKGRKGEWRFSGDEISRVQSEGPSPEGTFKNNTDFSRRAG